MSKGFSLVELLFVICVASVVLGMALPRRTRLMDWIATDRAARDVTTALAVGRHGAVLQGTRSRVTIAADSLRVDRLGRLGGWEPWRRFPGPIDRGVLLEVSNPIVVFGPTGLAWGVSNTRVVLRRGSQVETVTMSRVGRVKRW